MTFYIKQNDTAPALDAILARQNGEAVNLTGASVKFMMRLGVASPKVNTSATIVNAASGLVRYSFTAANTDTAGVYDAEFEVTYADATVETFPNDGYFKVTVVDDIA